MNRELNRKMALLNEINEQRQKLEAFETLFARTLPSDEPHYTQLLNRIEYLRKSINDSELWIANEIQSEATQMSPEIWQRQFSMKSKLDLSCFLPASLAMFVLSLLTSMIMASMLDHNILPKIPFLVVLCYWYLFQSFVFLLYGLGFMFRDIHR